MSPGKTRKKKKSVTYQVVNMVNHFLSAFGLFMTIVFFTMFFIFYQWKNVKIRGHLEDIDQLKQEILEINARVSVLESRRNDLIARVPQRAAQQLGMIIPDEPPKIFTVTEKKYRKYGKKNYKE